jgi:hypothetical protein
LPLLLAPACACLRVGRGRARWPAGRVGRGVVWAAGAEGAILGRIRVASEWRCKAGK